MIRFRVVAAALVLAVLAAVVGTALPAAADGTTSVPVTCPNIPVVGTLHSAADVTATDSVDPVLSGGSVVNTVSVPLPVSSDQLPSGSSITVKEVNISMPVPLNVTVTNVTFTPSSFTGQTYTTSTGVVSFKLTGSVKVSKDDPIPTVPTIKIFATVAGFHRILTWKVPNALSAKGDVTYSGINLGSQTVSCTPDDPNQALVTTEVGRAPVATAQSVSTPKNTAKAIVLAATDGDGDATTKAVVTQPTHGTLTGTAPNLTYTPAADYVGPDSFTFKANDGHVDSVAAATVSISVTGPANHLPVATPQSVSTAFQTAKAITLAGTDADSDPLTYAVVTAPAHGALTGTAPTLTYTPTAGYSGPDSFTFKVNDGKVDSAPATVSITVQPSTATLPGQPTITSAVPGDAEVTLTWTAPTDLGSGTLTGYVITPFKASVGQAVVEVGPTVTSTTLTGLTNGTGYTFRVAAKTTVGTGPQSIFAAATPGICAPFATCGAAVSRIVADLLGRPATNAEVLTDAAKLNAKTITLPAYIAGFRTSADHTSNVDPVTRLYRAYFLRIPDQSGLTFWIGERRAKGKKIETISSSFAGSSEFKARYGTLTNKAFVEQVYQNVLGRPGEAGGVAFWTGQLDAKKKTRGQMMVGFSESSEYKRTQTSEVDASVVYVLLLGRAPTGDEFSSVVAQLDASTPLTTIIRNLLRTTEYKSHIA